jgi:hypothetical protein
VSSKGGKAIQYPLTPRIPILSPLFLFCLAVEESGGVAKFNSLLAQLRNPIEQVAPSSTMPGPEAVVDGAEHKAADCDDRGDYRRIS